MEDDRSNFAQLLECPICTETMKDPIMIVNLEGETPCLHRFCRECVNIIISNETGQRQMGHCPGNTLFYFFECYLKF